MYSITRAVKIADVNFNFSGGNISVKLKHTMYRETSNVLGQITHIKTHWAINGILTNYIPQNIS